MNTYYIRIIIDTERLSTGSSVASCVYMVAPLSMRPTNQAHNELGVTVNRDDEVIWVPCAFNGNTKVELKKATSPGVLNTDMNTKYNADGTVTAMATMTCNSGIYRFAFTINDQDFDSHTWDPFITIE